MMKKRIRLLGKNILVIKSVTSQRKCPAKEKWHSGIAG